MIAKVLAADVGISASRGAPAASQMHFCRARECGEPPLVWRRSALLACCAGRANRFASLSSGA